MACSRHVRAHPRVVVELPQVGSYLRYRMGGLVDWLNCRKHVLQIGGLTRDYPMRCYILKRWRLWTWKVLRILRSRKVSQIINTVIIVWAVLPQITMSFR